MKELLSDAIDSYTRFRRSQDIKPNTLKNEAVTLRQFLTCVGNIYTDKITERQVTVFFEQAAKTKQPQSLRNDHGRLSVFFDWCRHTKRMPQDRDPLYGRRMPKRVNRERNRLAASQFTVLLDAAGDRHSRDRAVIAVLLYTLLRDRDAADLRIDDVDLEGGWLRARIHKTGLEDRLPITTELDRELRTWLTAYTEAVGPLKPHYRLLPAKQHAFARGNNKGQNHVTALKPETKVGPLGSIVNPVLESIGFPTCDHMGGKNYEGAHTIRRSGARALFDYLCTLPIEERKGDPLRVTQSMLHHKHVTQTEQYLSIQPDRRTRDDLLRGRTMFGAGSAKVTHLSTANG